MSTRFALADLPQALRAQAEAQLRAFPSTAVRLVRDGKNVPPPEPKPEPPPRAEPIPKPVITLRRPKPPRTAAATRARVRATPVGRLLWQIQSRGLPEPVREHRFHPVRRWRFDLAWPDRRVAFEIEGVTHEGGRHQRIAGFTGDIKKYNEAVLAGWTLIRATPAMVRTGAAFAVIARALEVGRT